MYTHEVYIKVLGSYDFLSHKEVWTWINEGYIGKITLLIDTIIIQRVPVS